MLSLFKKNTANKSSGKIGGKEELVLSIDQLEQILGQFPIGIKLNYCPEFMHEILLETIIIAYSINHKLIYSLNDVSIEKGKKPALIINHNGATKRISKFTEFSIIVPYYRDNESKLDYQRKSSLGRNGPLIKGNNLTLIAPGLRGGMPHLDTIVTRRTKLKEGIYRKQIVVYLEVLPDTLENIDQREHQRINTNIPVLLQTQEQDFAEVHSIVDFADNSAQLELAEDSVLYGNVKEGQMITMTLSFDDLDEPFSLIGNLYPKSDSRAVIILSDILKDGKFSPMDMLDKFEIKTAILNHPATKKPQ